jgi:bifunctional DNase/RNase
MSHAARVLLVLSALVCVASCKRLARLDFRGASTTAPSARESPSAVASSPSLPSEPASVPTGYVAMTVLRIVPTGPHGHAVLLEEAGGTKIVPIFVGGTEALSIELRQEGKRYPRPLTHDLLDTLLDKLGGELVKVQVDDLKDSTFVGRVYVRHEGRVIDVDARPSDAIALALGSRTPIFVSRKVVDSAGVAKKELLRDDGNAAPALRDKPRPDPISL